MFDMKFTDCPEVSFVFVYENLSELGKRRKYHCFGGFTAIFANDLEKSFDWYDGDINQYDCGQYVSERYNIDDESYAEEWENKYPTFEELVTIKEFTEFYYETAYMDEDFKNNPDLKYGSSEPIKIISGYFLNKENNEKFIFNDRIIDSINNLIGGEV